ncbi:hypothetical protein ABW20_dc0108507 [Dactylellina cionopaga]|nr:hypothetical protein ABW20_dc0108507 [Dactylellina cionopaga]
MEFAVCQQEGYPQAISPQDIEPLAECLIPPHQAKGLQLQHSHAAVWTARITLPPRFVGNVKKSGIVAAGVKLKIGPPTNGIVQVLRAPPTPRRPFHWGHNPSLCKFLTGDSTGYLEIYPSGYDYDLTHTLYYIPESNPPRTVPTSELTIEGVELVGITQLDKISMATLLEAVIGPTRRSPVANMTFLGSRQVEDFIEPQKNTKNSHYMYKSGPDRMDAKQREEYETLQRMRRRGLKLTSASQMWVEECGMDWPDFYFGKRQDIERELEYGKGPKSDKTWSGYWEWMASKKTET